MQSNPKPFNNSLTSDDEKETSTPDVPPVSSIQQADSIVVDLLKDQIEELKTQRDEQKAETQRWQGLYFDKEKQLNEILYPKMLDTAEGNQQTEEKVKKGFFNFFRK